MTGQEPGRVNQEPPPIVRYARARLNRAGKLWMWFNSSSDVVSEPDEYRSPA